MASGPELAVRFRRRPRLSSACSPTKDQAEPGDIDWSKPITGGPIERGFDYYFGVNAPNFSPYAFIENDRIVGPAPTERWPGMGSRLSQHAGPAQQGFDRKQIAPTLARKAVGMISDAAKTPTSLSSSISR